MSTVVEPTVKRAERSSQRRLSDAERHTIAAMWAKCGSISIVANHFNVHRNTVSDIIKGVRAVQNLQAGVGSDWRQKLTETLPAQSVDAIERSINDQEDVHKAAATALSHLKGIGALQNDGVVVNVATMISSVPSEWADRYVSAKPTVDVPSSDAPILVLPDTTTGRHGMPTNGATSDK